MEWSRWVVQSYQDEVWRIWAGNLILSSSGVPGRRFPRLVVLHKLDICRVRGRLVVPSLWAPLAGGWRDGREVG